MSVCLAKMYRQTKYDRAATATYKECLRQCPVLIEVIDALVELGVSRDEINALRHPQSANEINNDFENTNSHNHQQQQQQQQQQQNWIRKYIDAKVSFSVHEYNNALRQYSDLLTKQFPDNTLLLLGMARTQAQLHRFAEAIRYFRRVRLLDPNSITNMDYYAILLRNEGDLPELNKLTVELMTIDSFRCVLSDDL